MKKKLLIITVFIALITLVTGCTEKKKEEDKKETLTIKDDKTGYTATFKYDKSEDFKITDTDKDGKFIEVTIKSEKNNIKMEFYFFEMTNTSYNISYNTRKEQEGFKEYTFGKYKGYIYGVDDDDFDLNILLYDGGDSDMSIGLFGDIEKINEKVGNNIVSIFESKAVSDFMKSIEFTK